MPLVYKIATAAAEFEAIHHLNYRTFVEEIPQHPANPQRRLVDRFHDENTYAIAMEGEELVGMIAGRARRPFSLWLRLSDYAERVAHLELSAGEEAASFLPGPVALSAAVRATWRDEPVSHRYTARVRRVGRVHERLQALTGCTAALHAGPPPGTSSERLGQRLARVGCRIAWQSAYLRARNWVQVCLMGAWRPAAVEVLPAVPKPPSGCGCVRPRWPCC